MIFIETHFFTKKLADYLTEEEYFALQDFLVNSPDVGKVIPATGGLRKIRCAYGNKGKRGGVRIIYYWWKTKDKIYFLTLYAKNEAVDLSSREKKLLKTLVEEFCNDKEA